MHSSSVLVSPWTEAMSKTTNRGCGSLLQLERRRVGSMACLRGEAEQSLVSTAKIVFNNQGGTVLGRQPPHDTTAMALLLSVESRQEHGRQSTPPTRWRQGPILRLAG